jgi:hypothetical protein
MSSRMSIIQTEATLIAKDQLLDNIKDVELPDELTQKIKQITEDAGAKVKDAKPESLGDVPPGERRMAVLIEAHKKIRELLDDDQKEKWDQAMTAQARNANNLGIIGKASVGAVRPLPQKAAP